MLAPTSDFPFFLPGHVGVAWYDTQTTIQTRHEFIMEQIENVRNRKRSLSKVLPCFTLQDGKNDANIVCRVQVCPTVLRQTVCDLFPYRSFDNSDLSVVTISLKPDLKQYRKNKEIETEKMAQTVMKTDNNKIRIIRFSLLQFVLTAKNVCDKLRNAGYWADFINPFSGRPYLCPTSASNLYENDEKFRCLDFQIFEIKDCKVISNEENKTKNNFVGSLFTNAPSKKNYLNNIFVR